MKSQNLGVGGELGLDDTMLMATMSLARHACWGVSLVLARAGEQGPQ